MTEILFRPVTGNIDDLLLVGKLKRLWDVHGPDITSAFTQVTGYDFTQDIRANVGVGDIAVLESHSGITNREAMLLIYKSTYVADAKLLWLLCHELGHRLLGNHKLYINNSSHKYSKAEVNYEAHRTLFVFLIDVITAAFTDQVAAELLSCADDNYMSPGDAWDDTYTKSWKWAKQLAPGRRKELTAMLFDDKTIILPIA